MAPERMARKERMLEGLRGESEVIRGDGEEV